MSKRPDLTYELKDDTHGSRAKYLLRLERDAQQRPVFAMDVFTMPDEIYHNATRTKVLQPDAMMQLRFSVAQILRFATIMVEGISKHLESVRRKLYFSAVLDDYIELDGDYDVALRAHSAKKNARGEQRNSARLIMILTRKSDGEEMMILRLKRNRIIWFLLTLREMFHSLPKLSFPIDTLDSGRVLVTRHGDHLAIGPVWLHGREQQKFQDFLERVAFDFTFHTGSGYELFQYRQVRAGFSEIDNVVEIKLTRFTPEHRVYLDESGSPQHVKFLVSSGAVARLLMAMPLYSWQRKETELLHVPVEGEVTIDATPDAEQIVVVSDTQEIVEPERDSDLLINMIESQLALRVDRDKRFNVKQNIGKISLYTRYRDGVLNDENYVVKKAIKGGGVEDATLLPVANFDLGIHWLNIFAIIAEALHNTQGEGTNERGQIVRRWKFKPSGTDTLYILKTVYSKENKAIALVIDRFTENINPLTGLGENIHHGRMRIPLFKEHIRTLMKGLIRVAQQFDHYYFTRMIDVFNPDRDRFEKRNFGISRTLVNQKSGSPEESVFVGSVSSGEKYSGLHLSPPDRDHLKKSAYNRLLYGRWIPFVGDDIAMTFDGYLSDHEREYALEFDRESTQGGGGSVAALAILFATVSYLYPENDTTLETEGL